MRRSTFLGVLLLVLASVSSVSAQVSTTGTIQIILEDAQGGRLPGVTVTATAPDVVTSRTAVSDAQGIATLEALAPSEKYTIKASLTGFREVTQENVLSRSGQTTTLRLPMSLSTVSEQITVTASPVQVVDTTRAIAGQDITLQLTEALPTGRSYQSYLQLVPGVLPDSTISGGNPSSRSGMNWKDASTVNDNIGASTDNRYYFEGINVTDPVTGTFGANLNTEIIQEQKVITGGIPAEYVGAAGLISTVITKSGSNRYSGSFNYFFQNNNLVSEDKHNAGKTFSTRDTAFTIGGPVVKDKLWGFGSFRGTNRTEDVSASDTRQLLREVETTAKQGFAKVTWVPSQKDLFSFMFLNDPQNRSGSTDASVPNNRSVERDQGGNNFSTTYSRVWSKLLVDAAFNHHQGEITDMAVVRDKNRNTVVFQRTDTRTIADEQLGGSGSDIPEFRPTTQFRGSAQYQTGINRIKGGFEWARMEDNRDLLYLPSTDRSQYTSLAGKYIGASTTAASLANTTLWTARTFNVTNPSDFNGLIATANKLPGAQKDAFYNAYDTDKNGTITAAELGASMTWNSTAGNPDGTVNYYRITETALGAQEQQVRSKAFYAQDDIQLDRWSFNIGLRTERFTHYATTGESLFTFDWTWAPRLSAVFDLAGDGKQKLAAFYGRYYDPIRMDMTNFTGSLSGYVREEQTYDDVTKQWMTYRIRGGPVQADGFFAPTTKTPYTDEFQLQYETDLGHNISGSITYYRRQTRDIFEDFDPSVYTIPEAYGDINDPDSLFLGYEYFGFDPNNPPVANFFLGTLEGGKRNYNGLEFVARKRFSAGWQGLASYNYLDAKGNAVSDGNADFAGDVLWLDPRAPNMYGVVPGTIHHIFKMGGSYETKWNVELGGGYRWNSGTVVNKTQLASSRRLPIQIPASAAYEFGGVVDQWLDPTALGGVQNPSNGSADMRVKYVHPFGTAAAEVFLDVFNVFNQQTAVRLQDLVAGQGANPFLSEIAWLGPRRAFIGARIRF